MMVTIMPLHRKILIIISNTLFKLVLFMTIGIVAAVLLYTDRAYIPSVLERNDFYSRLIPSLLETNKDQPLTKDGGITLEDERVQQIITGAFSAEDIEKYTNIIIGSVYDWLEQESSQINFIVDLTEHKQRIANGLSLFAVNRIQELPLCTEIPTNIDPFSITCQPPFIDYATEQIKLEEQLLNEPRFLSDTIITEETIFGVSEEKNLEEAYSYAPTIYSLLRYIPLYIGFVLLVLALIVIFASSTRKIGMRKIGRGLIGAGVSLVFFTAIFSFVLPNLTGSIPILQSTGVGIDNLMNKVAVDLSRDYSWMIIKISAPLILVGAVIVFYAQKGRYKKNYSSAKLKSGVVSGNESREKNQTKTKKISPPIQSSELSDTKPKRKLKNKKYRKIPKKEL
jgi:hypothetical protein